MSKRMSKREYWSENEKQPEPKRPELKPCPFCGSEAELYEKRFVALKPLYTVECRSCTAFVGRDCETYQASKGYTHFYSKDDAIAAWNRRVKDER